MFRPLEGHSGSANSLCVTPDEKRVVSGSLDKTLRLWETDSGECLHILEGYGDSVGIVRVAPDGKQVVSGSGDDTIRFWEIESGECLCKIKVHTDTFFESMEVIVANNGNQAISWSSDAATAMGFSKRRMFVYI